MKGTKSTKDLVFVLLCVLREVRRRLQGELRLTR